MTSDRRNGARAALLALALSAATAAPTWALPVRDVDPLIGTAGLGNTTPGAQVPFGFATPGPDTTDPTTSGYNPSGKIVGFSQTHVSGTGGAGKYGNFRVAPTVGALRIDDLASGWTGEHAAPGSYRVRLTRWGVDVALTATRLAAVHRYAFPATQRANIVLDATSAIELPGGGRPLASQVQLVGDDAIEGCARMAGGWGTGSYRLCFFARADRPWTAAGTWRDVGADARRGARSGAGRRTGAWLRFDTRARREVTLAIGLSFRSPADARARLPHGDFRAVARAAARRWRQALAPVEVTGGSGRDRRLLATGLYRAQTMPHDLTGENVWTRSSHPHYEDYYAVWDTFRTVNPLLTVVAPRRAAAIVQSLVDAAVADGGWMPDARVAGNDGITQGGSHGDVLVADALAKGLRGIDYRTAYRVLKRDATVTSPHPLRYGRELGEYAKSGYLTTAAAYSASRTVEYGYDDFAVARVARAFGDAALARRLEQRSLAWRRLWDPGSRSIRPREPDGAFVAPFDAHSASWGGGAFYEGSAAQYSAFVPHDVGGLIRTVGGPGPFVGWLDDLFDRGLAWTGNEPGLLTPWLYVHAGRPDLTAAREQSILREDFAAERDGLSGNDDAGTLSAWAAWAEIGLFPNAGQPFYYLTAPRFDRVRLRVAPRRWFEIRTAGYRGDGTRYIAAAALDGEPLDRAWLTHAQLAAGGVLRLRLSDQPTGWASSGADAPPSVTRVRP